MQGQFQHTVRDSDRPDLLAVKYYGDSTRWWQINDANAVQHSFPTDILDERPVVRERFVLTHPGFNTRFEELGIVLNGIVRVRDRKSSFVESMVTVFYDGSSGTRQDIIDEIKNQKFEFRRAFAWSIGSNTAEAFTFDDPEVKSKWMFLTRDLSDIPGLMHVRSVFTEATLDVVYNSAMLPRENVLRKLEGHGFTIEASSAFSRIGKKLIVPPNQIG